MRLRKPQPPVLASDPMPNRFSFSLSVLVQLQSFLSHGEAAGEEIQAAQAKLQRLKSFAHSMMTSHGQQVLKARSITMNNTGELEGIAVHNSMEVIPISAKYRQNLGNVVRSLASLVRREREKDVRGRTPPDGHGSSAPI